MSEMITVGEALARTLEFYGLKRCMGLSLFTIYRLPMPSASAGGCTLFPLAARRGR